MLFRRRRRQHMESIHCCHSSPQVPLTKLKAGQRAEVCFVAAGRKARCRLASLGLIPGTALSVVANPGIGPVLLSVGESRLALERGVAEKVEVLCFN